MGETRVREQVSHRSGGMCERCGNRAAVHKHHRVNRSQGGAYTSANIVDLCLECHDWVGDQPVAAHDEGWHLHPNEDPQQVAVAHASVPGLMFYLLDDDAAMVVDPSREAPPTRPGGMPAWQRVARAERAQAARDGCRPTPWPLRDVSVGEAADAARVARQEYLDRYADGD